MTLNLTDPDAFDRLTRTSDLVRAAVAFATDAHRGQVRKWTGEPYVNHTIRVARMVAEYHGDQATVAAALLHDVLEDTAIPEAVLRQTFGDEVTDLVVALTDERPSPGRNRAARKADDHVRLGKAERRAQTIKAADTIDNTPDVVRAGGGFADLYVREKLHLLALLTEAKTGLLFRAQMMVFGAAHDLGVPVR